MPRQARGKNKIGETREPSPCLLQVISYTLSIFSTSIKAYAKTDLQYLEFGLCMLQNSVTDGVKVSVGYQISLKIGWIAIAAIFTLLATAAYLVPVVTPVFSKIGTACLLFATNVQQALALFATSFATTAHAIA